MRTAAAFVALTLCACACGPPANASGAGANAGDAAASAERDAAPVPILNFAKVDAGLWRGAQPDEAGFRALRDLGAKTIVSFRRFDRDDREEVPAAGLDLVEIPLKALLDSDPPTDDELRAFFDVALDPARRPVFVHCKHGKDRTGTMCAVYRMEVDGWTPDRAFEEMRKFGFHAIYGDLERFVKGYAPRFGDRVRAFAGVR